MRENRRIDYTKSTPIYREGVRIGYENSEESPKSIEDMLVNLSQEVAKLKRELSELDSQVDTNTRDIQTFAETATSADYKAGQALTSTAEIGEIKETIEMLTDDIVLLDERTQPLVDEGVSEFATELAEMIERKINESYRKRRI